MSMLSKLKGVLSKGEDEQIEQTRKRSIDVNFIKPEQISEYKKQLQEIKANIDQIAEICLQNKQQLVEFIKQQKQKNEAATKEPQDQDNYTIVQDLQQIKQILKEVSMQLNKVQITEEEIKHKVSNIALNESPQKMKELQGMIAKYEAEIKTMKTSEENNREILNTLKQQTQLLSKQTKDLQEKNMKIEKELAEKTNFSNNLMQQKNVLLQMRNHDSSAKNPEVEGLKAQLVEFDKRLALQKTKLQQKEKQVESLKRKLQEDRQSLETIADQLKDKELKFKKYIDKYEKSKTDIRKYREEKTQFIKKLNIDIANLSQNLFKMQKQNKQLKEKLEIDLSKIQKLQGEVSKNQNRGVELETVRSELTSVRKQILEISSRIQEKQAQNFKLKEANDQLQLKRKTLLQALEKPVNHQIRTLEKIIKALQKLYKDYISTVFEQGNIVGFQNKITYILSNVREIKEDLLL